jgi:phage-related protein
VPKTDVVFYREEDRSVPILDWLDSLPAKGQDRCLAYISLLEDYGHELRRPQADYLRDGIYELRPSVGRIHYRILYFFSGKAVVVISHGIAKESRIPPKEIELAIKRKKIFEDKPEAHSFRGKE